MRRATNRLNLDWNELRSRLELRSYRDGIKRQFEEARGLGISAIPSFVIGRYLIRGAQPYEVFMDVIRRIQIEDTTGA